VVVQELLAVTNVVHHVAQLHAAQSRVPAHIIVRY
jgi:hypothetical protein